MKFSNNMLKQYIAYKDVSDEYTLQIIEEIHQKSEYQISFFSFQCFLRYFSKISKELKKFDHYIGVNIHGNIEIIIYQDSDNNLKLMFEEDMTVSYIVSFGNNKHFSKFTGTAYFADNSVSQLGRLFNMLRIIDIDDSINCSDMISLSVKKKKGKKKFKPIDQ